jgi:hypothetical protein
MEASISFKYIIKNLLIQFLEKMNFFFGKNKHKKRVKQRNRLELKNSKKNMASITMTLFFYQLKKLEFTNKIMKFYTIKKLTNVLAFGVRLIDILFILKIKDL